MGNELLQSELFRNLSEEEHLLLRQEGSLLEFQKKGVLFKEREPAEAVWFILSGWVRLVRQSPQGRPVTIFVMTPKEPICGVSALVLGTYTATAIAATKVKVVRIPRDLFLNLLEKYPSFSKRVIEICCKRIQEMILSYATAYDRVDRRIAHVLLRLSDDFGNILPFTHREISEMGGTALETSIRVLSKMKRKGWLTVKRGEISILKRAELKKVVGL
ncbi:MAG: Crp/Fnr family transcriptional regulator [Candidatus Omnitrophica bacterium]|nr:Crp/Fnr family transcriptional regulator [Candidatus Omnitrophota bacterium]